MTKNKQWAEIKKYQRNIKELWKPNDWLPEAEDITDELNEIESMIDQDINDDDGLPATSKKPALKVNDAMAERIMDALCEDGRGDFFLLKDDEVREWWAQVVRRREIAARREAERRRRAEVKENALKKLTEEERKILGIK